MNQRGFTLLEVLIATTISTLVLGSALWLLGGGLDTERRVALRQQASEEMAVLARRLEHELATSFPSEWEEFQGEPKKIQFSHTTAAGLAQVEWESKADGIYTKSRQRRTIAPIPAIKISSRQGNFSYLDQGGEWKDSWHSDGLPLAVRVELEDKQRLIIPLEAGRVIPCSQS